MLIRNLFAIALTGAFHEDGLADSADGLGGGQTPARRLEIMKDSRLGSYGALTLGLTLAQTFVQQHQGTIECESEPGRTVFKILIPLP